MTPVKILLLASYFYPEQAASSYLAENRNQAFAEAGFDMLVYTPVPTRGITDVVKKEYRKRKHELMYDGKMTVRRFSLLQENKNSIIRAVRYTIACLKQFSFAVFASEARQCNIMFISSTPPIQGAMAALVKKFRKLPLVYNLQDIFPDSLISTGLTKKGSLIWKIGRIIENFTYRNADKIIVISNGFKQNIIEKGVPEGKIVVVYNWVDQNVVVDIPRAENKIIKQYNLDPQKFYVTYCGNIGLTQNLELLVDVAKSLEMNDMIQFVIIGNGVYLEQLKENILQRNISNITLLPFQPYEDISHVFSLGDVGLIISKPGVGANSVPSKTWSIMSASRPVLANFDENEIKTILTEKECGIFTKAGDKKAFVDAIIKLYENRDLCKRYGYNGRKFVIENLSREVSTQKYVDILKEVCCINGYK